jgi:hypothetical protein
MEGSPVLLFDETMLLCAVWWDKSSQSRVMVFTGMTGEDILVSQDVESLSGLACMNGAKYE